MSPICHGNNTSNSYYYDARTGKLSQILATIGGSTVIQQKVYNYTAIGEISSINDQHNGVTYNYIYDNLGRLTNENRFE